MLVIVKVHRTHGGDLAERAIVLDTKADKVKGDHGIKEGEKVWFANPCGGGSSGTILFIPDQPTEKILRKGISTPSS